MSPAEEYIIKQKEPFKTILLQLQSIVEASAPNTELLYKWRIPFYYSNGTPLCYLNKSKDYVDLAFWHGDKIKKYREHFVTTNRKSVTSLRFKSVEDINDEVIAYVIQEQLRISCNPFKLIRVGKAKN